MKRYPLAKLLIVISLFLAHGCATKTTGVDAVAKSPSSDIREQIHRATVRIDVPEEGGGGSGTVIATGERTLVLTNDHVVDDSERVFVSMQQRRNARWQWNGYEAVVIARHAAYDLAVVEVNATAAAVASLARTMPKHLDRIYMAGTPFGRSVILTSGAVALPRLKLPQKEHALLLLSGSTVLSGNSGGAVYNANGRLIGVPAMLLFEEVRNGSGKVPIESLPIAIHLKEVKEFLEEEGIEYE